MKCGTKFISTDGKDTVTCDRDGRHIVHKDSATGRSAVRVPGGAVISQRDGEGYVVKAAK